MQILCIQNIQTTAVAIVKNFISASFQYNTAVYVYIVNVYKYIHTYCV